MLSNNIREIRKTKGMTQEQLAEAMGVSTASVSKWETGQSAPEITVLVALADFFEVSVDALLGHEIKPQRCQEMIEKMKSLADEDQFDEAKEIAHTLLRNYPNSYEVVKKVADLHYQCHVRTFSEPDIRTAINLTHRLFALMDPNDTTRRLELMQNLGNQYEHIQDWATARKYYTDSNVGGVNDLALTGLLIREGKMTEALEAASKFFGEALYQLFHNIMQLKDIWLAQEQPDKALAALNWAMVALSTAGPEMAKEYGILRTVVHIQYAAVAEEMEDPAAAEVSIRSAMALLCGKTDSIGKEFTQGSSRQLLVSENIGTPELLLQMLSAPGSERLLEIARDEMKKYC